MNPSLSFKPAYLGVLAIATVSLVAVNGVLPGVGIAIAASAAMFFLIDTGGFEYLAKGLRSLQRKATGRV